jgi:uncharacterized protein (TIGR03435 family)
MAQVYRVSCCLLLLSGIVFAQARPQFEVASIRPSSEQVNEVNIGLRITGSQVRVTAMSLKDYLGLAYTVIPQQISGPEWLAQVRFDVLANIPDTPGAAEKIPEMMQELLADRFQLTMHRESREFQVYALGVGTGRLNIRESAPDPNAPALAPGTVDVSGGGSGRGIALDLGGGASFVIGNNRLEARKLTMADFAELLTRFYDRPVVDTTGLEGRYDVTLDIAPEDYTAMLIRAGMSAGMPMPPQAMRLLDGASTDPLGAALRSVGMTFEQRRAPLDVIVVDSMLQAPTEN